MLRSKIQHLLNFNAAESQVLEVDGPPESMAGWMKGLGSIDQPAPAPDNKDGQNANKPAGDPPPVGDNKAGAGTPDPNASGTDAAAKQAAEAAKAAADKKAADAKAAKEAEDRKQAEAEKAKATPAEEKWPRTSADWDKFKENRKQEREKLEREIKTRDETITTLQTKVKEVEEAAAKLSSNGDMPDSVKKEIDRLTAQVETYSQRLQELDVTAHPDFQSFFKNKVDEQISIAKEILGDEKGKKFEEIVNIPDHPSLKDYKKAAMDDFINELSPYESGAVSYVMPKLKEIERERQAEIGKAKSHSETLKAKAAENQKAKATQTAAEREKMFNEALDALKDDKVGIAAYQKRNGDDVWNKALEQRVANAKRYLFGAPDLKKEEIARAALHAAAFPTILEAYKSDMAEKNAEIEKLAGQVKALTASQPGARNGGGGGGGDGEHKSELRSDMNPFEASQAFAKQMMAARNEE